MHYMVRSDMKSEKLLNVLSLKTFLVTYMHLTLLTEQKGYKFLPYPYWRNLLVLLQ